jgi:hypothetical protein
VKRYRFGLWLVALLFTRGLEARAESNEAVEKQLVGAWRLVTSTQKLADGTVRPSPAYGEHQAGYMIYTDTHMMCSVNVNQDRPKWASPGAPSEGEMKAAFAGFGAYCATFSVNAEERSVTHHVQFDKSPNAAGTDRKRFYTLEGNRLILKIDPRENQKGVVENTIIWERVAK